MNQNDKTLEVYNRTAKKYAKLNNGNEQMKVYHEMFHYFLPEGIVYDVGCGTGRDVQALQDLGYDVTGVDASESMLNVAKETYPNCTFEKCNLLEEISGIPKVDGLWACASLLHFNENEFKIVFEELLAKLNRKGVFYFSVKIQPTVSSEVKEGRFFQYYTRSYLDNFLEEKSITVLFYNEAKNRDNVFANYIIRKDN